MSIRIAVGQFKDPTEEDLRFAAQLGATGVQVNCPPLPGEARWAEADVKALVARVEAHGLVLEAIENVPVHFYDDVMLGRDGRDAQIENYIATMRAVAAAGVPILGHHFMPNSVWRTDRAAPGRGGAGCTAFDMETVARTQGRDALLAFLPTRLGSQAAMPLLAGDDALDDASMIDNYLYFMRAVLPVAEEIGLKLALHPDDPPMPALGGVARIFCSPEGFKAIDAAIGDSPSWGLDLCLGSVSEMEGGADAVHEMIEHFGGQGAHLLRPLPRRARHRSEVPGVLPRRRQLRSRRGDGATPRGRVRRLHPGRPRAIDGGRHRLGTPRAGARGRLPPRASGHGTAQRRHRPTRGGIGGPTWRR